MPGRLIRPTNVAPPAASVCLPNSNQLGYAILNYSSTPRAPLWVDRPTSEPTASGATTSSSVSAPALRRPVWSAVVSSLLRPCYSDELSAGKRVCISLSPMPSAKTTDLRTSGCSPTASGATCTGSAGRWKKSSPAGPAPLRGRTIGRESSSSSTALPRSGATAAGWRPRPEQYFSELALLDRRPPVVPLWSPTPTCACSCSNSALSTASWRTSRPSPQAARRLGTRLRERTPAPSLGKSRSSGNGPQSTT